MLSHKLVFNKSENFTSDSQILMPPTIPINHYSDTSCLKLVKSKGSIGRAFTVCIRTENQNQASICPFALREVSVLAELALGHLRYYLTDVPPQSNSPPDAVVKADRESHED